MCGGSSPAPRPAPPPPPVVSSEATRQPAKAARGRRRTQASATFSSPRQAAAQKSGAYVGTLLSQENMGGNTLLGA
mgnify:CR=1 FL=1